MERRIRLIIEGQDRASGVINGAANSINSTLGNLGNSAKRLVASFVGFQALRGVFHGIGDVFRGIGGAIADTAEKGMTFNKEISAIAGVTGASAKEVDALRETAIRLGRDTSFSSNEAATAIKELAKAGVDTGVIVSGAAEASMNLAAAGGLELADAAEIMSKAMNSFNLEGKDAAFAADLLTGAANASATSVHNIGEAVKYAGPMMQTLSHDAYTNKQAFQELTIATSILSQGGIDAGMAGAGLQRFLEALTPNSEKAKTAMMDLGLVLENGKSTFFDAQGNFIGLKGAIDVLNHSMRNLTEEERVVQLETMFGQRAGRVIMSLMNQTYEGAKSWDKYAEEITEGGIAVETANVMLGNLAGAVEIAKGSLESMQLSLWTEAVEQRLMVGVGRVALMFQSLADKAAMPGVQRSVEILATVLGETLAHAVDIIQPKLEAFFDMFGAAETHSALYELGNAFQNLISVLLTDDPVIYEYSASRRYAQYYAGEEPKTAADNINTVARGIQNLVSVLNGTAREFEEAQQEWSAFASFVSTMWNEPGKAWEAAKARFVVVMDEWSLKVRTTGDDIVVSLDGMATNIFGWLNRTSAQMVTDFGIMWQNSKAETDRQLAALKQFTIDFFTNAGRDIVTTIKGWGSGISGAWDELTAAARRGVELMLNQVKSFFENFSLAGAARQVAGTAVSGLTGGLSDGIGSIISTARSLANAAVDTFRNIWKSRSPAVAFIELGADAIGGLIIGMEGVGGYLTQTAASQARAVMANFAIMVGSSTKGKGGGGGTYSIGYEAGEKYTTGTKEGTDDGKPAVLDSINTLLDDMARAAEPGLEALTQLFADAGAAAGKAWSDAAAANMTMPGAPAGAGGAGAGGDKGDRLGYKPPGDYSSGPLYPIVDAPNVGNGPNAPFMPIPHPANPGGPNPAHWTPPPPPAPPGPGEMRKWSSGPTSVINVYGLQHQDAVEEVRQAVAAVNAFGETTRTTYGF